MSSEWSESFLDRLLGVIALKRPVYDALQHDSAATGQAWLIVLFLGIANGIAVVTTPMLLIPTGDVSDETARLLEDMTRAMTFDTAPRQVMALIASVLAAVLSWYLSSALLRFIGNRMAGDGVTKASGEEVRRLVGWGYAPSLASLLTPIPVVGPLLALLGWLWAFVTGVMAVRAAFNVGIGKAIAIELIAFLVILVVVFLIALLIVVLAVMFA